MVWLLEGVKSLRIRLLVLTEYTNVTDGQTLHDGMPRASPGKKTIGNTVGWQRAVVGVKAERLYSVY